MYIKKSGQFVKGEAYALKNSAWEKVSSCHVLTSGVWLSGGCAPIVLPVVGTTNSPTVYEGDPAVFTATCTGCDSKQWQISTDGIIWNDLVGEIGDSYIIAVTVYPDDSGKQYRLVGTNSGGFTEGAPGTLTVIEDTSYIPLTILSYLGTYWTINDDVTLLVGGSNGENTHLYEQQYTGQGITLADTTDFLGDEFTKILNAGGNYFYCILANWQPTYLSGAQVNVYPFAGAPASFDLTAINQEWVDRIDAMLYRADTLGIVVQLSIFDTDYNISNATMWAGIEWNPANVIAPVDYTTGNTGLTTTPQANNDLFTAPALAGADTNPLLIAQKIYVQAIADIIQRHTNVMVQIQDASAEHTDWSDYWTAFLQNAGVIAPITTMQDPQDIDISTDAQWAMTHGQYIYGDSSQQWWNIPAINLDEEFNSLVVFASKGTKPVNAAKIYETPQGDILLSIDKLILSLITGNAAAAFHPGDGLVANYGIGVIAEALQAMEAVRWLDNNTILENMSNVSLTSKKWKFRTDNESWAIAGAQHIAIYVNSGNAFQFNTQELGGSINLRWKDVIDGTESSITAESSSKTTDIINPFSGNRAILVITRV